MKAIKIKVDSAICPVNELQILHRHTGIRQHLMDEMSLDTLNTFLYGNRRNIDDFAYKLQYGIERT